MPTQEERLAIVEQAIATSQRFQREATDHIRATDENTTILLGVIRSQGHDIKRICARLESMDLRFDRLETRLDEHTRTLYDHTALLNEHTRILNEHTMRFDRVEARLERVETSLERMEGLLKQVLERMP
jgi:chromosome segregation ATPase